MKKVNLYNKTGKLETVYVFTGTDKNLTESEMGLSDIEKAEISKDKAKIKQINASIHDDDNIKTIKKKLLKALDKNIALEELYLFYPEVVDIEPLDFYNKISNYGKERIYGYQFGQVLFNTGFKKENTLQIPYKQQYFYMDILAMEIKRMNIYKPLGFEFSKYYDYNFSGQPFHILQTQNKTFKNEGENVLMYMENQLYFDYYKSNTLHLVCAESIMDYCSDNDLNQEYFIELYFPLLHKKQITNKSLLLEQRDMLIIENQRKMKEDVFLNYENVDFLYSVSKSKSQKLPYIEKGIRLLNGKLYSKINITLPLENIFKNVHCDRNVQIIKFNPGNKKENIYRVFTTTSSKTGKAIPFVSKQRLISVSKQTDKAHTIAFHIKEEDTIINIILDKDCNIQFDISLKKGISKETLETMMKTHYHNISVTLNNILLQVGFKLPTFDKLEQSNFEIKDIHYDMVIPATNQINMTDCNSLFALIFDSTKEKQNEIHMNYKRVSNYKYMDAINKIIYDHYQENQDDKQIIQLLVKHHKYTEKAAIRKMTEFFNNFNRIRGKFVNYNIDIVEQPGFPTTVSYIPFENKLLFHIEKINSIHYLQHMAIYIDSLLTILLYPELIKIPGDIVKSKCSETVQQDDDNDNMVITNDSPKSSVMPLEFTIQEDVPMELDNEDGIFFDDGQEENIMVSDNEEDDDDGIFFDDEDDDDEMTGGKDALDGQSLKKKPNLFFKRLNDRDPKLFRDKKDGKFDSYSRICPFNVGRQPVILNDTEKNTIDTQYPGSYTSSVSYNTDDNTKYHYICPKYWCLKTNTSMTQEQVDSGICGKVIPPGSKTIPEGHYVYQYTDKNGKYSGYSEAGFLDPKSHPDGKCMPCCFKPPLTNTQQEYAEKCNANDAINTTIDRNNKSIVQSERILSHDSFPINDGRIGYLPPNLAQFLHINYSDFSNKNKSGILAGSKTLLRIGVEQSNNKSFIGCLAEIHKTMYKTPTKMSINDFCNHIAETIKISDYVSYNNGSLMSQFKTNNKILKASEINKTKKQLKIFDAFDVNLKEHQQYMSNVIQSFANFKMFLTDPKSNIDHTYLWDILCSKIPRILNESINLIILEFENNDITNNISIICPNNAYSAHIFDENKRSVLLYKNKNFYEIIAFVEQLEKGKKVDLTQRIDKDFQITEFFKMSNNIIPELNDVMKAISNNIRKCSPLPSNIKTYNFHKNLQADAIIDQIKITNPNYKIKSQIVNYQGKTIGIMVSLDNTKSFYVPTYPSSNAMDTQKRPYEITTMDNLSLWNDYKYTKMRLEELYSLSNGKVLCKPKLKVLQDNLIVGIITITNQFIQINPPVENIDDELEHIQEENHILADRELLVNTKGNSERIRIIQKLKLETQFYNAFRNVIRILLHKSLNHNILEKISFIISYPRYYYEDKLNKVNALIKDLTHNFIEFSDYEEDVLMSMNDIFSCFDEPEKKAYCIAQGTDYKLHIPRQHLITDKENKTLYFNRISDELIRNQDISQFLLVSDNVLRIPESNYIITDNEFIILHSLLQPQYFDNLEPFSNTSYTKLNVFSNAQPESSQYYSNKLKVDDSDNQDNIDCIHIVNNTVKNKWKNYFPKNISESVYKNTPHCSFSIIQNILKFENTITSVNEIKNILIRQYNKYETSYGISILSILSNEGKKDMISLVKQNKKTMEEIILSNEYFISDLDIIMIFNDINVPVVLYSDSAKLKIYKKSQFLTLGNRNETIIKHHFIYTPNKTGIQQYSLINQPLFFSDLSEQFEQSSISKSEVTVPDIIAESIKK